MPGAELIRQNDIMKVVNQSAIDPGLALEDYEKEKARWAAGGTPSDLAVVEALKAAEEGRVLVDLNTVIARGGIAKKYNVSKLPGLTLAPPGAREVSMRVWHDGDMVLRAKRPFRQWKMTLSAGYTFPRGEAISYSAVATVPQMPPDVRNLAQKNHLLLWEPEWRKAHTQVQRPPIDPALLEPLSGSLYVVLATWDLTELEAAALA